MPWPHTIPADLRRMIENALGRRSVGSPEIWGEVRDWLIKHGVEAPDHPLPEEPKDDRFQDQ